MARVQNALLGVLTYFSIKFGTSFGVEKENVSDLKFRNFDAFLSVHIHKGMIHSRGNGKLKL